MRLYLAIWLVLRRLILAASHSRVYLAGMANMKQEYSEDAAYHFDLTQAQRTKALGDANRRGLLS